MRHSPLSSFRTISYQYHSSYANLLNTPAYSIATVGCSRCKRASLTCNTRLEHSSPCALISPNDPPRLLHPDVRYAPYTCDVRTRVFEGREDFLRWEAAVELRCALDGAVEDLPRGWAEANAGATENDEEEEEADMSPEIVELDSDGIETMPRRDEDLGAKAKLSGGNVDDDDDERVTEEDVRAAIYGLKDIIVQFLPAEEVVDFAAAVSPAAVAIALVCARCLHAHEGAPHATVGCSQRVLPDVLLVGKGAEHKEVGEEAFLGMLKKACSRTYTPSGRHEFSAVAPSGRARCTAAAPASSDAATQQTLPAHSVDDGSGRHKTDNGTPACGDGIRGGHNTAVPDGGKPAFSSSDQARHPTTGGTTAHEWGLGRNNMKQEGEEKTEQERRDDRGSFLCERPGNDSEVPEFLWQLEAGWVLASAVWEGVVLLERARDYGLAVELLAQLLATR